MNPERHHPNGDRARTTVRGNMTERPVEDNLSPRREGGARRASATARSTQRISDPRWIGGGLFLTLAFLAMTAASGLAADAPTSTRIIDTMVLQGDCTIAIVADTTACVGTPEVFTADLTCADGTQQVNDPQWFIDGEPAATGIEVELSIPLGDHLVEVTCGSCQDQLTVHGAVCADEVQLDAIFSDDDTEDTSGIFMNPNLGGISQASFNQYKFLMRPFTLDADSSVTTGTYEITRAGDSVLELWTMTGQPIALPATFDRSELPVHFLVNATDVGDAELVATYVSAATQGSLEDRVRVRVGRWDGLSGHPILGYPYFHTVNTFNDNEKLSSALDPVRHAERVGLPYDVYVVPHRSPTGWAFSNSLTDVSGGVETAVVNPGSIADNVLDIWTTDLDPGSRINRNYDIVYDFGQDGTFDPGDLIDGFSNTGAGCYVVADLNLPGSHTVISHDYSGGTFLGQRIYYPSDIGDLGQVPLIILSHGNGHNYTWYDYLGNHFASYGYVFMSHTNNTQPGIEAASTTTLTNTDYLLGNLDTIEGGVLEGHIQTHNITWIGHSRGGEGVVRAYDRVLETPSLVENFTAADIKLIISIAPTVFLSATTSDPHDVTYYLLGAGADGDVSGAPNCPVCQYFRLSDRSLGTVQTIYVHGAGHNDFNCCGFHDATGPDLIGRAEAQVIAKSYFLAVVEYYIEGNQSMEEYITRLHNDLTPTGMLSTDIVATTHRELNVPENYVIDDFQTEPSETVSSSGGTVSYNVSNFYEGYNEDQNSDFNQDPADPMNGMILHSDGGDFTKGIIFDYTVGQTVDVEWEVVPAMRDVRRHHFVSFRACQGTRHTETRALDGPHTFAVSLRDGNGVTSTVRFGAWGSLTPLYQRTGYGSYAGWVNEMNTVEIPLAAFETDGSGLDLSNIVAVRLEFGSAYGSNRGRIAVDDLQFVAK